MDVFRESNNWEKLLRKILDTTLSAEVWENGEHPLSRVELYEEITLPEKVLMFFFYLMFSELVLGDCSLSYLSIVSGFFRRSVLSRF